MRVDIGEKTGLFRIVELTQEQLNTVLNCIMFAKDRGMEWPKDKSNEYENNRSQP